MKQVIVRKTYQENRDVCNFSERDIATWEEKGAVCERKSDKKELEEGKGDKKTRERERERTTEGSDIV